MSLHKITAGIGYDYLTRQVAAMDSSEKGYTGLASYGNDTLIWPHRDGLFWTRVRHSGAVVTV